jgi:hypothetical protein
VPRKTKAVASGLQFKDDTNLKPWCRRCLAAFQGIRFPKLTPQPHGVKKINLTIL